MTGGGYDWVDPGFMASSGDLAYEGFFSIFELLLIYLLPIHKI